MVMISRSQSCELRKDSEKVPGSIPGATTFCFSPVDFPFSSLMLVFGWIFFLKYFHEFIVAGLFCRACHDTVKMVALRDVVVGRGSRLKYIFASSLLDGSKTEWIWRRRQVSQPTTVPTTVPTIYTMS